MATPYLLKKISAASAKRIIREHSAAGDGRWEGLAFSSDFVYDGRATRYGRRLEMLRPDNFGGRISFEHAVVSN